ncbi:MAG: annexin [archaeon]|nr:annexin [archaeon]
MEENSADTSTGSNGTQDGNMECNEDVLHNIIFMPKSKEVKEASLIQFILNTDRNKRLEIREKYERQYKKKLLNDINLKFSGNFKDLVIRIFQNRNEFDAFLLISAFKDYPTNEDIIYEVLLGRNVEYLEDVKEEYIKRRGKAIEDDIQKYFKDPISKFLIETINKDRSETKDPNRPLCEKWAMKLTEVSCEKWLLNKETLSIFSKRSKEELVMISRYYLQITGVNILREFERLSPEHSKLLKSYFFWGISPAERLADQLDQSTYNKMLFLDVIERIVVDRYDIDLRLIKKYLENKYKRSLEDYIMKLQEGNHQKLLLELSKQDECTQIILERAIRKDNK